MTLLELLEPALKTGDMITRKNHSLHIRYSQNLNTFMWCLPNGELIKDWNSECGFREVVLTGSILSYDDWYLTPIPRPTEQTKEEIVKEVIDELTSDLNTEYIKASVSQMDGRGCDGFLNGLKIATQIVKRYTQKQLCKGV